MWIAVRAPGLVTVLAGHGIAALTFLLSFRSPLRSIWFPQFFILLSLATVILLGLTVRRDPSPRRHRDEMTGDSVPGSGQMAAPLPV